jgi:small subunit ribosomal protein S20
VPNIKSAQKRVQVAERNRLRNKNYSSAVKTLIKKYFAAVEIHTTKPTDETEKSVQESMAAAFSKIDKAVKTGVLHRNNGARKKSRLARVLKQAQGPVAEPKA